MSTEQQKAIVGAYLSFGSHLEKLAEEANQIFQDDEGKAKATFDAQTVGEIAKNLPHQLWVGSAVSI